MSVIKPKDYYLPDELDYISENKFFGIKIIHEDDVVLGPRKRCIAHLCHEEELYMYVPVLRFDVGFKDNIIGLLKSISEEQIMSKPKKSIRDKNGKIIKDGVFVMFECDVDGGMQFGYVHGLNVEEDEIIIEHYGSWNDHVMEPSECGVVTKKQLMQMMWQRSMELGRISNVLQDEFKD